MLPRTQTHSNRWRWSYPAPDGVHFVGAEGREWLRGADAKTEKLNRAQRRAKQDELLAKTGYAGGNAELGHRVENILRQRGYPETVCQFAGHLCAIAGSFNFQGNYRIAELMHRSVRTIQRCRGLLELAGLIKSCCLERGQMVDGMRSPVLHAQICRDVSVLQRMAFAHTKKQPHQRSAKRRKSNTVARAAVSTVAVAAEVSPISADSLDEIAAMAPDFLQGIIAGAAEGKRELDNPPAKKPEKTKQPPPVRRRMSAEEIDAKLAELPRLDEREPDKPPLH